MMTTIVGQTIQRTDAVSKVTGRAAYPGDLDMDGQLWMKVRFSDRVHARIVWWRSSQPATCPITSTG